MGVNWGKRLGVLMPKDRGVFGLGHRHEFHWRKKKVMWPWQVGPTRQRGREKKMRTGSGSPGGPRADFLPRPKEMPRGLFLFFFFSSFSFFLFLFLS
jgi:hypothetical protein